MSPFWGPGATSEVSGQRRGLEGFYNRRFEHKVGRRIVRSRVRLNRGISEDLDRSIIAGGREVFVRRIEGDAFDMTAVD